MLLSVGVGRWGWRAARLHSCVMFFSEAFIFSGLRSKMRTEESDCPLYSLTEPWGIKGILIVGACIDILFSK